MLARPRTLEKTLERGIGFVFARGVKSSSRKKTSKLPVVLNKVRDKGILRDPVMPFQRPNGLKGCRCFFKYCPCYVGGTDMKRPMKCGSFLP